MADETTSNPTATEQGQASQPSPAEQWANAATAEPATPGDETGAPAGDDSTAAPATEGQPPEQDRQPKGVQKRIDELVSQREDAKRERDYWRQVAMREPGARPEAGDSQAQPQVQQQPVTSSERPKVEDFKSYEEWAEALTDWKLEQRDLQVQQQTRVDEVKRKATEVVDKGMEKYPDFKAVVLDNGLPINPLIAEYVITEATEPVELAYFLGKNPKEVERIAQMNPFAAIRALGKIEAELQTAAQTKIKTNAPDPINPLGGAGAPGARNTDEIPMSEWIKLDRAGKIK